MYKTILFTVTLATALATLQFVPKVTLADDGDLPLSDQDIAQCILMAQDSFGAMLGNWMKENITGVETKLSSDRTELDIRIHYVWGAPKMKRYFCGFEYPGRLGCDPAFSGPGAL